jgi:hypothetical protein
LIQSARSRCGASKVNPSIPLDRALDIYEAALSSRAEDAVLGGMVEDAYRPGRYRASRDLLLVRNILRDCA